MEEKIKVLIVDDSALVRKIIGDALESDPMIEVVGTANNGKTAVFKNQTLNPDVITMDIEMPIMNGLDALREIMATNAKPVIMMSVLTQHGAEATFKALDLGAIDFIPKPSTVMSMSVDEIKELLISKVKSVYKAKIKLPQSILDYRRERELSQGKLQEVRAAAVPQPEIKPLIMPV
ncbi:MAG: response regulator, partial [Spirochaetota bacterium]